MSARLIALVDQSHEPVKTRQFRGLPPELTGGVDYREKLSWPRILIIENKSDGIFLFRFTQDGICVGDTCHTSIEDAQQQARSEYGDHIGEWQDVPQAVDDCLAYALEKI